MGVEVPNRQNGPALGWTFNMEEFPQFNTTTLGNGLRVHTLLGGTVPAVVVRFLFRGGSAAQRKFFEAQGAMNVMPRGTIRRSEEEVFEQFDRMGSRVQWGATSDISLVTLTSTTEHLLPSLSLVLEILREPAYHEKSVRNWARQAQSALEVERQQPRYLATKALANALYGSRHPYSRLETAEDYAALCADDLRLYHRRVVGSENCQVVFSGGADVELLTSAQELLGEAQWGALTPYVKEFPADFSVPHGFAVRTSSPMENQVSITLGRLLPRRPFEGLLDLEIATVLLGGFFGSRLIRNIREEKGYTYGIYAHLQHREASSELRISAEVGNPYAVDSVKEIEYELRRLQEELVSEEELSVLRGYLAGWNLRGFDGPFASAQSLLPMLTHGGMPEDWFSQRFARIFSITPEDVRAAAQRWFSPEDFVLSLSGADSVIEPIQWSFVSL